MIAATGLNTDLTFRVRDAATTATEGAMRDCHCPYDSEGRERYSFYSRASGTT